MTEHCTHVNPCLSFGSDCLECGHYNVGVPDYMYFAIIALHACSSLFTTVVTVISSESCLNHLLVLLGSWEVDAEDRRLDTG